MCFAAFVHTHTCILYEVNTWVTKTVCTPRSVDQKNEKHPRQIDKPQIMKYLRMIYGTYTVQTWLQFLLYICIYIYILFLQCIRGFLYVWRTRHGRFYHLTHVLALSPPSCFPPLLHAPARVRVCVSLLLQDPSDYPRRVQPNQLFVDMDNEVVFVPVNGMPVPLSIHTIKNVTQPDPDNHCHYLRINFFTSGAVSGDR